MTYLIISQRCGPLNYNLFHERLCSSPKMTDTLRRPVLLSQESSSPISSPQVQSWIILWLLSWSSMHSPANKYMVAYFKQLKWWKAQKEKKRKTSKESPLSDSSPMWGLGGEQAWPHPLESRSRRPYLWYSPKQWETPKAPKKLS